jgi:tripartite-type tricarboxylate transporter receptor subunit TctC
MRGIVGSPDMPEEAKAWYEDLFRKVFESAEWQDFMKENGMVPIFKGADEYKEWLVTFEDNHVRMMKDVFGWELRGDLRGERGDEE